MMLHEMSYFPGLLSMLPDEPATFCTVCPRQELWRGRVEQVSWSPRAFVYHNFLTDEECEVRGMWKAGCWGVQGHMAAGLGRLGLHRSS